jgi:uncharacterized protein
MSAHAHSSKALPCRAGVGLKPEHLEAIFAAPQAVGFFEVHAENFMAAGGPMLRALERVRRDYALSIHGVGLSIGSDHAPDAQHVSRLKNLLDRFEPASFSEHLAWSSHRSFHGSHFYNDLLPLPYTGATLQRVCAHITQVQDILGRRLLLENPATYVEFAESSWVEGDFVSEIVRRTGCGLLLDVNNLYVSAVNHHRDALHELAALPLNAVGEIHLAGFARERNAAGAPLLIDSHGAAVDEAVWALYAAALAACGPRPTLIEWDNEVPAWPVLLAQCERAQGVLDTTAPLATRNAPTIAVSPALTFGESSPVCARQADFARALLDPALPTPHGLRTWNASDPAARFAVYRNNVTVSLIDALADTFPTVHSLVGDDFFRAMAREFVREQLPTSPVLSEYGAHFSRFIAHFAPAASLPYLPDMAHLEWARQTVLHAADAPHGDVDLASLLAQPERLAHLQLRLIPACVCIDSDYAVVSLWAAHQADDVAQALSELDTQIAEAALIVRLDDALWVLPIPAAHAPRFEALIRGVSLGEVLDGLALAEQTQFFTVLVRHALIVDVSYSGD